jgi:hypothetical protein
MFITTVSKRTRNGSEERNWGSQCFFMPNEMRQPRDALLLTPHGPEMELNLSLSDGCLIG